MSTTIYNVYGTDGIDLQEKLLCSAEFYSDEDREILRTVFFMFGCLPNVRTSTITRLAETSIPNKKFLPADLIKYAINSYERKQKKLHRDADLLIDGLTTELRERRKNDLH